MTCKNTVFFGLVIKVGGNLSLSYDENPKLRIGVK